MSYSPLTMKPKKNPPGPLLRRLCPTRSVVFFGAFLLMSGIGLDARNPIRSSFFSYYPGAVGSALDDLPSNGGHCGVCHYDFNGGGPRNPYGVSIEAVAQANGWNVGSRDDRPLIIAAATSGRSCICVCSHVRSSTSNSERIRSVSTFKRPKNPVYLSGI